MVSEGRSRWLEPAGHRHQQMVADAVSVGVVDGFEAVQVQEQHRRRFLCSVAALQRVVEQFQQQRAVGQPGERIVQGQLPRAFGGVLQFLPGLGVDQIGGGDIGQGLGGRQRLGGEAAGGVPVEVERAQLMVAVAQRKGEHRPHALGQCAGGEVRETLLVKQFRYLDGFAGGVGQDARSLAEFGLQLLVEQCRSVRGADVPGVFTGGDRA